ncbi:polyprenyl synthetase family protein [Candidatus Anaplasma sp. TIGMIC]|uniref:polyprenyl synthetase family protein n=1 Tax=Candidatus Anaplasma sp. TIGMIC TaxID=3020713 RepID=UPI00232D9717|nr:polyprenyl synthetase family protein [Candidatus Anaplasma sp. TIGMIC]MDB1135502.1 polyprenyl synthetase family protein [Candidatus Anaplasma sp. TIGMIC]
MLYLAVYPAYYCDVVKRSSELMQDTFSCALHGLRHLVAHDVGEVENLIIRGSNSDVKCITDIVRHLVLSGGKRLRPIMLLVSCGLLGCAHEKRTTIAAAIEFIHGATLLHDDVVDRSDLRRGKPTANSIWGNKASILVGDYLFAMAFQWVLSCNSTDLLSVFSEASSTIIRGEIQQLVYSSDADLSRAKYVEIVSSKTAALFSAACEAAAVLADADFEQRSMLRNIGMNFGIVFQILDDIMDYTATESTTGKRTYNDLSNGKVTLPFIITYECANDVERSELRDVLSQKKDLDADMVLSIMAKYNAIGKSVEYASEYVQIAEKKLGYFSDSPYKSKLLELLHSATARNF